MFIKMASFVFTYWKFPQICCKKSAKTQNFEITRKIHPIKRENVSENFNHMNLVPRAVTKNPIIRVNIISSARKEIEQLNYCCSLLFASLVEILRNVPQRWGIFESFKNLQKWNRTFHSEFGKDSHCSAMFQSK